MEYDKKFGGLENKFLRSHVDGDLKAWIRRKLERNGMDWDIRRIFSSWCIEINEIKIDWSKLTLFDTFLSASLGQRFR